MFLLRILLHSHFKIISANVSEADKFNNCTYMIWDSWLTKEKESEPSTGVGILSDSKLV